VISVSDILKLLEQVPGWKALSQLPKRLAALEDRVAALETKAGRNTGPAALECPICGGAMRVVAESAHVHFGSMGMKTHAMECSCGHKTTRDYVPGEGYH
jgi:hypothetical protein